MNQEQMRLLEIEHDGRELRLIQQDYFKDQITQLKIRFMRRIFWITGSAVVCLIVLAAVHCRLLHHYIF